MRTIGAGVSYFLCVFAAGFLLGPVRVLWLQPRLGELAAVMVEAPILLLAMFIAARLVARGFGLERHRGQLAVVGGIAVLCVVAADVLVGWWLRNISLADQLQRFATLPGQLYGLLLIVFAVMPSIVGFRRAG